MAVVSEGKHFPSTMLTGYHVLQIIRHHRISKAEAPDKPFARVRLSRQCSMIVQQPPCDLCIMHGFQIPAYVAFGHQFGTAYLQFCNEFLSLNPERSCSWGTAYRFSRV